jgi:hypothetical protein
MRLSVEVPQTFWERLAEEYKFYSFQKKVMYIDNKISGVGRERERERELWARRPTSGGLDQIPRNDEGLVAVVVVEEESGQETDVNHLDSVQDSLRDLTLLDNIHSLAEELVENHAAIA